MLRFADNLMFLARVTFFVFAQDFLEEAPMSWDALVKKTFRKKEEILPMQMAEVRSLHPPQYRYKIFLATSSDIRSNRAMIGVAFLSPDMPYCRGCSTEELPNICGTDVQ